MIKKLLILAAIVFGLASGISARTSGDWKIHNTFDAYLADLADSPEHTYMLAYGQQYIPNASGISIMYKNRIAYLFDYDKTADELISLNKRNRLSDNVAVVIRYNPVKKYLLIGYENGNIDLLYDDGTVKNVPGLMTATINNKKDFNNVVFDTENNKAYIGTYFGYVVVDDSNFQISDSRIFNENIESIGRAGNNMIVFTADKAYTYPANKTLLSVAEMTPIPAVDGAKMLMPLSGNSFAYIKKNVLYIAEIDNNGKLSTPQNKGSIVPNSISNTRNGYYIAGNKMAATLSKSGSVESFNYPADDAASLSSSWDGSEIWFARPRKGIASMKRNGSGWTLTRDNMMPNGPNALYMSDMAYTDEYGMLTVNHGHSWIFSDLNTSAPILLNNYKNGEWTPRGIPYVSPGYEKVINHPRGLTVDPDNPAICYFGSVRNGLVRIDMENPQEVHHYTRADDPTKNLPGFHGILSAGNLSNISAPAFDNYGNLWFRLSQNDVDEAYLMVWPAADRRKNNADGWKQIEMPVRGNGNEPKVFPMHSHANRNLLVVLGGSVGSPIYIYDFNGTPTDASDDRIATMTDLFDQDGGTVSKSFFYDCYEDPESGMLWVCSNNGIYTFYPKEAFNNPSAVRRIKISRNDGTNLADYLLAGAGVYSMTVDSRGHKWFGTDSGGLIETSPDGTEILNEFKAENSYLPSNVVYAVEYNKASNSIMMSTEKGVAEYFIQGSSASDDKAELKAYPNPVRPDYYGWITIEGVADNSLVKIVDSAGNLVKELGRAENGVIQWDGTNHQQRRVRSGVYYIFTSGTNGDSSSNSGKIVVVN